MTYTSAFPDILEIFMSLIRLTKSIFSAEIDTSEKFDEMGKRWNSRYGCRVLMSVSNSALPNHLLLKQGLQNNRTLATGDVHGCITPQKPHRPFNPGPMNVHIPRLLSPNQRLPPKIFPFLVDTIMQHIFRRLPHISEPE